MMMMAPKHSKTIVIFLIVCITSLAMGLVDGKDAASSSTGSTDDLNWNHLLQQAFVYSTATVETWVRAFALGFGGHMLLYMVQNSNATYQDLMERVRVSMICGFATGCLVFGSSLLIPAKFRMHWFD